MSYVTGGCSCGSVRFRLIGPPIWTSLCHCDACKKRTGSAFGFSLVVDTDQVAEFTGETTEYVRRGDSGKACAYEFCPKCGTTVRWKVDLINRFVFAGGALDKPETFPIVAEMYTGQALEWARLHCDLEQRQAPNDAFRNAATEKARELFGEP